jgi:hypothetical protein
MPKSHWQVSVSKLSLSPKKIKPVEWHSSQGIVITEFIIYRPRFPRSVPLTPRASQAIFTDTPTGS